MLHPLIFYDYEAPSPRDGVNDGNGEFPIIFLLLFHKILLHEENFFLKLFSQWGKNIYTE